MIREQRFGVGFAREVDLVHDDPRRELVGFGDDEKTIEHPWVRRGFHHREYDDNLIDVRGNDSLAARTSGRSARQLRSTRQNRRDRCWLTAVPALQLHFITNRELDASLLEPPAQRAFMSHPV